RQDRGAVVLRLVDGLPRQAGQRHGAGREHGQHRAPQRGRVHLGRRRLGALVAAGPCRADAMREPHAMEASDKKAGWRPSWWSGRSAVIGIPYVWLLLFFLAPFLIVAKYSVSEMGTIDVEPVAKVADGALRLALKYSNYVSIATDNLYFH